MESNVALQPVQNPPEGMLKCSKCEEWKSPEEFHKNFGKKTGRHSQCKPCRLAAIKYGNSIGHKDRHNEEQVTSIIRQMAVLEYKVKRVKAEGKHRIAKIEAETNEIIDDTTTKQAYLRRLLKKACKRLCARGQSLSRQCLYGNVRYAGRKLKVILHPDIAYANRDKP